MNADTRVSLRAHFSIDMSISSIPTGLIFSIEIVGAREVRKLS